MKVQKEKAAFDDGNEDNMMSPQFPYIEYEYHLDMSRQHSSRRHQEHA
jgi:hypothetical protein